MRTTKFIAMVAIVIGCTFAAQAQNYTSAIGLRLGYPVSISYKHFLNENGAIEVFGGFRSYSGYGWFNVGGLYQYHKPIPDLDGLSWYFGGGASAFFWNYDNDFVFGDEDDSSVSLGILGNLGLDFKFANTPLNLSVDWVPIFFLNGYGSGFGGGYGAFAVRYVLK